MRRGLVFLVAAIFIGGFFIFVAVASQAQILISQIQISGVSSTDEFVELYNNSSSSVSLTDLALKRITGGGGLDNMVSSFSDASAIQPFGYFLIAHPDYSPVGGVNADFLYTKKSCGSCMVKDNGVVLINGSEPVDAVVWGLFLEPPAYSCGVPTINMEQGQSIIRKPDTEEGNGQDTDDCSLDFISNAAPVPHNSLSPSRPVWPPIEIPTSTPTSTPETPTSTPSAETSTLWAGIRINEFVSDPASGNEWAELYNPATSSLDLAGGWICDSRGATSTYACKSATGTVPAGDWLFFDLLTASFLNNDGDSVILKNPDGATIDSVDYAGSSAPDKGQSLARKIDGADTDTADDWAITTSITPGAANVITAPTPPAGGGGGGSTSPQPSPYKGEEDAVPSSTPPVINLSSSSVFLNEIYPNPPGSDTEEEFIEIKNSSTRAVDLSGWKISDLTRSYNLSGAIQPGQIIFFKRPATKISLNNTTREEVKLTNAAGAVVDSVGYASAAEGESFSRDGAGVWKWTIEPTPGAANKIVAGEVGGIVWKINAPSSADVGEVVAFDAEDSADERGGELFFGWVFSDGFAQSGGEVERAFTATGTFDIVINASSTSGSNGQKKISITVGRGLAQTGTGVIISEVLANPAGDDSAEFIELFNSGAQEIDLSGWSLRIKNGKTHLLAEDTIIPAQKYLVFYRAVTGFALNNSDERVELINRDGAVVDLVKIGKSESGKSLNYLSDEWVWSDAPTPGEVNVRASNAAESAAAVVAKASSKKITTYQSVSLDEARTAEVGDGVKVKGLVAVLPGVFGSQYFYIVDGGSGMQVYQYKKDFPELKVGDLVEVTGIISEASGIKRIKLANRGAVDILSTENSVEPLALEPQEVNEENLGALVKIAGEITEIKTNYLYLDNGAGEIKVYFKKGATIDKNNFKEGENVEVMGVVEQSAGELQLWPRAMADIVSFGPSADLLKNQQTATGNNSQGTAEKYLTATAGGLSALILALLARARGALALAGVKKVVQVAVSFFKRG
ncbi:MAG: lamin tail domain-containing protein [Patescibacteria group bacterium]|nr:lamin tail domain-containing protein [Patescibacteria group bacterium]